MKRAQQIPRTDKPDLSVALQRVDADPKRRNLGDTFTMPLPGGYAAFTVVR